MEKYLKGFEVERKNPSEDALRRWRKAIAIVKNPRRRFRMVADLAERAEAERRKRSIQERIVTQFRIQKAALQFLDAGAAAENASDRHEYPAFLRNKVCWIADRVHHSLPPWWIAERVHPPGKRRQIGRYSSQA